MSSGEAKRVDLLVLGASFAGIEVLYQLWRRYDGRLKTIVVDRQAQHGYIPLVQERLVGRIDPETSMLDTAAYVRSLPGTELVTDDVTSFSPDDKEVTLASGRRIRARIVVIALGSVLQAPAAIEGHERLVSHKLGAQFDDARARVREVLQGAKASPQLVVVGGGISGVELAGELAHLQARRPEGWAVPKVTLVSGGARLVENLPASVARAADRALRAQNVDVRLSTRLRAVQDDAAVIEHDGETERLPCALTLWAGGVAPAPVLAELGLPRTEDGWLSVGPTLQCFATAEPTHYEIFACGDAVRIESGAGRWNTMQRAIECLWQAKVVAKNIVRLLKAKPDAADGPPPLSPHRLRERFPYGVSVGARSLLVLGPTATHIPGITPWFRRFLMRQYFERYTPLPASER